MAKDINKKIIRRNKNIPPKNKQKSQERFTWKRILFILILIIFIISVAYVFLCSQLVDVTSIEINGTNRLKKEKIVENIQNSTKGYVTSCIRKKNYFFIDKDALVEELLKDERIKSVNISKQFPNVIVVDIVENEVIQVWCNVSEYGSCFIVENGILVSNVSMDAEILKQNKYFIIIDEIEDEIHIEDRVMSGEYLDKIELLGEELIYVLNTVIEKKYKVASKGSHEVQFMTDEGWYIVVDVTHNVDEILDVAKLFIKKVELPSGRNDLEYVDMRFPERIFYKMKDGVEEEIEDDDEEINDEDNDIEESENDEKSEKDKE